MQICNGKLLDGLIQSLGFHLRRMHACRGVKVTTSGRRLTHCRRDKDGWSGRCVIFGRRDHVFRRSGLAAPGSLRMRLTVQSVTTIIPKHEASFRASFETVEKLLVLFNRNNYFYRYIYVMNKVFPKDCFVHVCQLGYRLKMITKRVQDKCKCQTFNAGFRNLFMPEALFYRLKWLSIILSDIART